MIKHPTQTKEPNKILALGEKLRENPRTILLSIPVLGFAIFLFSLAGNKRGLAGAYGHLGLTFRLYYKHHWQKPIFLETAYQLLSKSAKLGTGDGQPTVRMVMGSIAFEQKDYEKARSDFEKGVKMAHRIGDSPQEAFIESHLGRLETLSSNLLLGRKYLSHSYKVLAAFAKGKSDQRPHIWLTNVEIGMSELYLAEGDKRTAIVWADKVAKRAQKYNLETRKLDVSTLKNKIREVSLVVLSYVSTSLAYLLRKA